MQDLGQNIIPSSKSTWILVKWRNFLTAVTLPSGVGLLKNRSVIDEGRLWHEIDCSFTSCSDAVFDMAASHPHASFRCSLPLIKPRNLRLIHSKETQERWKPISENTKDILILFITLLLVTALGGIAGMYANQYVSLQFGIIAGILSALVASFAVGYLVRWGMGMVAKY